MKTTVNQLPCVEWPGTDSTCGSCALHPRCKTLADEGLTEKVNIVFASPKMEMPKVDLKEVAATTTKGILTGWNWTKDIASKVAGKTKDVAIKVADSKPMLAAHGAMDGIIEEAKAIADTVKATVEESKRK